ncbi:MAG: c-type cytochrome [Anaerolineales bacterium]
MPKFLKWFGIVVGVLLVLVLISGFGLHILGKNRWNQAPQVATHPVPVPSDDAAVTRSEYLVDAVSQCRMCHGENLEGQVFIEGEMGICLAAPNLTSGKGGIGAAFSDADWARAIRHGIGGDGRVLVIMPSNYYSHYSNADLGDLIAYLKQIPAVDNELGPRQIGFSGSIMGGVIGFNDFTHVGDIDHAAVGAAQAPSPAETAEYGQYLVQIAMCWNATPRIYPVTPAQPARMARHLAPT